jgi:hypothetical protein
MASESRELNRINPPASPERLTMAGRRLQRFERLERFIVFTANRLLLTAYENK